jgi:hypothetical protein
VRSLNSAVRRRALLHQQLRRDPQRCAHPCGSEPARVVRGAPTQVAGRPVGNLVQGQALAPCRRCRRGKLQSPRSKTVIDKVLAGQGNGLHVLSASVNCASWVTYLTVGTALPLKGRSCIAPLLPRGHHRAAAVPASALRSRQNKQLRRWQGSCVVHSDREGPASFGAVA